MAEIRKVETKTRGTRWKAIVSVAPHRRVIARFERREQARVWATCVERDLRSRRHLPAINAELYLFPEIVDRYIHTLRLPLSHYERQKKRILERWVEEIGAIPLSHCTPALLSAARDRIAGAHYRKRSPETVNFYLAVLGIIFNLAVKEWQVMATNPLRKVARAKIKKKRERFLNREETERLLRACRRCTSRPLYLIVLLALATGARKSEILTLTWSQVTLATGATRLPVTKSGRPRSIYIKGAALEELRRLAEYADLRGYIFRSRRSFRRHITIDAQWRRALADAGIDNFRFHDLRHTFASWMAEDGASLLDIQAALGHSSAAMVQRYAHLTRTHVEQRVEETASKHLAIEGLT